MPRDERPPSFPMYPQDLLGDPNVVAMSDVGFAGYMRLMLRAWAMDEAGVLPEDDRVLAALSGLGPKWKKHRSEIAAAFDTSTRPGCWVQKRMVAERAAQLKRFENASARGMAGARGRWRTPDA